MKVDKNLLLVGVLALLLVFAVVQTVQLVNVNNEISELESSSLKSTTLSSTTHAKTFSETSNKINSSGMVGSC